MKVVFMLIVVAAAVVLCDTEAHCDCNLPGDITGDCKVDISDLSALAAQWLQVDLQLSWAAVFDGDPPVVDEESANAIAIDTGGNVYVTGRSGNGAATIKYGPDCNIPVWVARYDGPHFESVGIAVDGQGNVYVTGSNDGYGSDSRIVTVKYDADRREVWVAKYAGSGFGDRPVGVVLDAEGSVYVAGSTRSANVGNDFVTIKYTPDGNQLWAALYNGPGNGHDTPEAVAIDDTGCIYVAGSSDSGIRTEFTTIKYDKDGNTVWLARYSEQDWIWGNVYAMTLDGNGHLYVTGYFYNSACTDTFTLKYSVDSNVPLWGARYAGPGDSLDYPAGVVTDSKGNAYVLVQQEYEEEGYFVFTTVKYDANGNEVWESRYPGPIGAGSFAEGIVVDNNDSIYVSGETWAWAGGRYRRLPGILKYNPDSNALAWTTIYYGGGEYGYYIRCALADDWGNLYLAGERDNHNSEDQSDYLILKYSPVDLETDIRPDGKVDFGDFAVMGGDWLTNAGAGIH